MDLAFGIDNLCEKVFNIKFLFSVEPKKEFLLEINLMKQIFMNYSGQQ